MRTVTANILKAAAVLITLTIVGYFGLPHFGDKDLPQKQKLADCLTNAFAFKVAWPTGELFSIVLGVPHLETNALNFRGDPIFKRGTGTVARVEVASDDVTPCNWLDNSATHSRLAGYILTWGGTNAGGRLDGLFEEGLSYEVEVRFTKPPPTDSSLWLHWIGQVGH